MELVNVLVKERLFSRAVLQHQWQTYTAILPRSHFNVVLLRLVMQDAARAVFDVWSEVRIKVYVDD